MCFKLETKQQQRKKKALSLDWQTHFFFEQEKNYPEIWKFQKQLVDKVAKGEEEESVIFCEHESVLTLGRRSQPENVRSSKLPSYEIERGGDVTWHGPGQLVLYPIFRLHGEFFQTGLHGFLRFWEELVIRFLSELGVDAGRYGPTGVWVRTSSSTKKIASLGIAVRRWVTYHGLSLNIQTSAKDFSSIRPCNFEPDVMTSLKDLGFDFEVEEVAYRLENLLRSDMLKAPAILSKGA